MVVVVMMATVMVAVVMVVVVGVEEHGQAGMRMGHIDWCGGSGGGSYVHGYQWPLYAVGKDNESESREHIS